MSSRFTKLPDGTHALLVPVDDRTTAWLCELADMHHVEPQIVAAAILRDVREDDEDQHLPPPPSLRVVGGTDALN